MALLFECRIDPVLLVAGMDPSWGLHQGKGAFVSVASSCNLFCLLEELAKLLVCAHAVSLVVSNTRGDGNMNLGQEELNPRCRARNENDLPGDFLQLLHREGLTLVVEGLEESLHLHDERWEYTNFGESCVNELAQDLVEV